MREFPRDFTLIGSPQGNFEHCLLLLAHSLRGYFPRGSPVAMTLLMEWGSFPGKILEPLRKLSRVGGFPGEAPCCHGTTDVMREFPWEFLEPLRKLLLIIAYYKRWSYPREAPHGGNAPEALGLLNTCTFLRKHPVTSWSSAGIYPLGELQTWYFPWDFRVTWTLTYNIICNFNLSRSPWVNFM